MNPFASTFAARQFGAWAIIALAAAVGHLFGPGPRGAIEVLIKLRLGIHALATLGLPTANIYFVARDPKVFAPAARTSLALGLVLGLATAVLLSAVVVIHPSWVEPLSAPWAIAFFAAAPAILVTHLEGAVFLGADRVGTWNLLTVINRAVMLLALGLAFLPPLRHLETVLVGLVVAEWATTAFVLATLRRDGAARPAIDRPLLGEMRRYGARSYVNGAFAYALLNLDTILLGSWRGTAEAGQYAAAGVARDMVLFLPWMAGMLFLPKVAGAARSGARPRALGVRGVAVVLGASVLLFVFAREFVVFVHGPGFEPAAPVTRVLIPAALLAGAGSLCLQYLLGKGAPRAVMLAPALALAVSLLGNAWAIPAHGALGTAWVALAASAVLLGVSGTAAARLARRS